MEMPAELVAYLSRVAHGDESVCPPNIDVVWHACLADPQWYQAWCLANLGVIVEHVVARPGPCHARVLCRGVIRQSEGVSHG
jgi:hypothetical protein